jgi:hypothetical protein
MFKGAGYSRKYGNIRESHGIGVLKLLIQMHVEIWKYLTTANNAQFHVLYPLSMKRNSVVSHHVSDKSECATGAKGCRALL